MHKLYIYSMLKSSQKSGFHPTRKHVDFSPQIYNWEKADTLQDIAKIIKEQYNYELGETMESLLENDSDDLECLKDSLDSAKEAIEILQDQITEMMFNKNLCD